MTPIRFHTPLSGVVLLCLLRVGKGACPATADPGIQRPFDSLCVLPRIAETIEEDPFFFDVESDTDDSQGNASPASTLMAARESPMDYFQGCPNSTPLIMCWESSLRLSTSWENSGKKGAQSLLVTSCTSSQAWISRAKARQSQCPWLSFEDTRGDILSTTNRGLFHLIGNDGMIQDVVIFPAARSDTGSEGVIASSSSMAPPNSLRPDQGGDGSSLMQTGGGRLRMSERLVRPRRPQEWLLFLQQVRSQPTEMLERVKTVIRNWLSNKINQVGHVFLALSLMLRDTLFADMTQALEPAAEDAAQRHLTNIQEQLLEYLERNHRWSHQVHQQFIIQECLRQAVRLDELDVTLFQMEEDERNRVAMEEVGLMFRTNSLVRDSLPAEPSQRSACIRLIIGAVRDVMGTEARHLRRLGVCLHGLQMIGEQGSIEALQGDVDSWLPGLVDDIHLLAGADNTTGPTTSWSEEVVALRRWLAEDRLSAQHYVCDPTARSSHEASSEETDPFYTRPHIRCRR